MPYYIVRLIDNHHVAPERDTALESVRHLVGVTRTSGNQAAQLRGGAPAVIDIVLNGRKGGSLFCRLCPQTCVVDILACCVVPRIHVAQIALSSLAT